MEWRQAFGYTFIVSRTIKPMNCNGQFVKITLVPKSPVFGSWETALSVERFVCWSIGRYSYHTLSLRWFRIVEMRHQGDDSTASHLMTHPTSVYVACKDIEKNQNRLSYSFSSYAKASARAHTHSTKYACTEVRVRVHVWEGKRHRERERERGGGGGLRERGLEREGGSEERGGRGGGGGGGEKERQTGREREREREREIRLSNPRIQASLS